jgi:adenylate cyclase
MAESMAPDRVISLLNEYFNPSTDIILSHEGEIERFMGDGIFASFSTPSSAARAALLIARQFQEINHAKSSSDIKLNFRMGINAGTAVQGNVGSRDRMEYTIIGDAVNLASRLEAQCEPGHILISKEFYELGKGQFLAHEPFQISVKGKANPVTVCYLYGFKHLVEG